MRFRDCARFPQRETRARRATAGKRPQRLRDVVAATHRVVPRRQPHRHARLNRGRVAERVAGDEPAQHQEHAEHHQRHRLARHAIQRKEQAAEHERRAKILLEEEQHEREPDADEDRQDVVIARDLESAG